ncbi:hypothetical protein [Microbacterium sp. NPDC079995]|uniref:hypothetical protein n=1 Tax=unclassified Microbacterium TaxID=2609290 RepID=UPI00344B7F61
MSHIAVKAAASAGAGAAMSVIPLSAGAPELAPLIGWAVAATSFLVWSWTAAWPAGP